MKKKINLIIDRFEENLAVLINEEGTEIIIPEEYLPQAAREADILKLDLSIDKKLTKRKKKEIRSLISKLKANKR